MKAQSRQKKKERHPAKPLSAYNIFFRSESKRLRDKERCRAKLISLVERKGLRHLGAKRERPNTTLLIANKWKKKEKNVKLYFEAQGKERLEEYRRSVAIFEAKKDVFIDMEQLLFTADESTILRLPECRSQKEVSHREITRLLS